MIKNLFKILSIPALMGTAYAAEKAPEFSYLPSRKTLQVHFENIDALEPGDLIGSVSITSYNQCLGQSTQLNKHTSIIEIQIFPYTKIFDLIDLSVNNGKSGFPGKQLSRTYIKNQGLSSLSRDKDGIYHIYYNVKTNEVIFHPNSYEDLLPLAQATPRLLSISA